MTPAPDGFDRSGRGTGAPAVGFGVGFGAPALLPTGAAPGFRAFPHSLPLHWISQAPKLLQFVESPVDELVQL